MTSYTTKYSALSKVSKRERKQIETSFPFMPPNANLSSIDWCAQKVNRNDFGLSTKFCPLCDIPMIVRIQFLPCEHIICYECSLPESDFCYVCESKVEQSRRIQDKMKLFECDYPDCFKIFETIDKMYMHKQLAHNQQCYIDIIKEKPKIMPSFNPIV